MLDTHDPHPTAGAKIRLIETVDAWKTMKAEMERIITEEVGGFNQLYIDKKLPILILPEKEKSSGRS